MNTKIKLTNPNAGVIQPTKQITATTVAIKLRASVTGKCAPAKTGRSKDALVVERKILGIPPTVDKMGAISDQVLFDFDAGNLGKIRSFPERKPKVNRIRGSENWFQMGLELERTGAPVEDAVDAYQKVLEINPGAAGALVNLGTVYYRLRKFDEAEKYYLAAIEADPAYPLAQFNLGNLYDEQGRHAEALEYYRRALALNPHYADAHFNLALLCERQGDAMKAVHHWKAYLKLDSSGQSAEIARCQLECLRQALIRQGGGSGSAVLRRLESSTGPQRERSWSNAFSGDTRDKLAEEGAFPVTRCSRQ
jgi:tetratricopeptide (TPR) repeat protein